MHGPEEVGAVIQKKRFTPPSKTDPTSHVAEPPGNAFNPAPTPDD